MSNGILRIADREISYEEAKGMLFPELIPQKGNGDVLAEHPHDKVEDMAVVYRLDLHSEDGMMMSTRVNQSILDAFGISAEQMKKDALENAPHIVIYYGAPVVMLVCYDKEACWTHPESGKSSGATDATIVATHMMMEAVSLGLGTAWISYFDENKARELLGIPASWQPVCMLYVGYTADDYTPNENLSAKRKTLDETCFFNLIPEASCK